MAKFDLGEIEITLDEASLSKAVLQFNLIQRGLNKALKAMYQFLLDEGVTIARFEIVRLCDKNWMTGDLWMSVGSSSEFTFDEKTGNGKAYITAGDGLKKGSDGMSYAVYVEYGTGIYSEERKKQEAKMSSRSFFGGALKLPGANQNNQTMESVKPMHFRGSDGKWYTIYGQTPKPFMRNTMYDLWVKAKGKWAELLNKYLPHDVE